MSTSFISHSPSPSTHSRLHAATGDSPAESYPSRCASPLLPMGQHRTPSSLQTVDPDRLSQQLGKATNRQSQQSIVNKNYAIPEGDDAEPPEGMRFNSHRTASSKPHRRTMMSRQKSYRIATTDPHQSSVRELSSKLKSACRKLNPKRLAKHGHNNHQHSEEPSPLPDLPYPEVFGGGVISR